VKLAKALAATKRVRQLAQVAGTPPPTGQYRTIVVDPPWEYADEGIAGAAARHYATTSGDAVKALGVASLAAPDGCHLYLRTTAPKLEVAFQVLQARGFAFKTMLVWRKNKLGLGRYFRSQTEFGLIATRGGNLPLHEQRLSNVVNAPASAPGWTCSPARPERVGWCGARRRPRADVHPPSMKPGTSSSLVARVANDYPRHPHPISKTGCCPSGAWRRRTTPEAPGFPLPRPRGRGGTSTGRSSHHRGTPGSLRHHPLRPGGARPPV